MNESINRKISTNFIYSTLSNVWVFHIMGADKMAGMVPIPGGVFWVYFTGVAMIAAGVSIIIRKYVFWACMGLALLM